MVAGIFEAEQASSNYMAAARANGLYDPVVFFTHGLILEPKTERFPGISNYFYLPSRPGLSHGDRARYGGRPEALRL
jgi:hypothetical protein